MSKFSDLAKMVEKEFGGNAKPSEVSSYLDTGFPPLNKIISGKYDGGFPVGRISEIYGPESSGKTALATAVMIDAQRKGGIAALNDHERSFSDVLAAHNGLMVDDEAPWFYQKPKTYEESLEIFLRYVKMVRDNKIIGKDDPICYVFDSLASMIPMQQSGKNFTALNMNDTTALARVTSTTMKSMALMAQDFNVAVLFLNQTRMQPGVMYGDPVTTPGGKSLKFYASVRLALSSSKMSEGTGDKAFVYGSKIAARTVKNKIYRPFLKAEWGFRFDENGFGYFDRAGSLLEYAVERGVVEDNKGWLTWLDGSKYRRNELVAKIETEGLLPALTSALDSAGVAPETDGEAERIAKSSEE